MAETLEVVSHEQDGRILSGVGASAEDLAATMDRHTPDDRQVEPKTQAAEAPLPQTDPLPSTGSEPSQPEKPTRGQKRFADLTREREEARREAAALKAELEQLKARPASVAPPAPAAPQTAAAPPEPPKAKETRPKPTEDEIGAKYASYADFVEDLADWKSEQRLAALDIDALVTQRIEGDRASRSFQDTVSSVLDAGRKAFSDFDAVRQTSDVPLSAQLLQTIFAMEKPEHVIYRLAKDRDLAVRLATSDPYTAGLLLATLKPAAPDASPASSGPPLVTPPPAPYQPVQGSGPTTVTPSSELAKQGFDFDKSGYRERRAAERGVRRR